MFEQLFTKTAAVVQHRAAPYVIERERFLVHCKEQGYTQCHLKRSAANLLAAAYELESHGGLPARPEDVEAAADRLEQLRSDMQRTRGATIYRLRFIRDSTQWLRFLDQLQGAENRPPVYSQLLEDFTDWMRDERALSPATIRNRRWHVGRFLAWYFDGGRQLADLRLQHIDAFFESLHAKGFSKVTIKIYANGVRVFVRHAERRGWCDAGIAEAIAGPRIYRQHGLPNGPSWDVVKKTLALTASDSPVDIRNRAIIMLFAVYGLRANEVASLRLEDVDWEHDHLRVPRPKPRREDRYPLAPAVGEAIARYLQVARPKDNSRSLFLKVLAPIGPMTSKSLYFVVSTQLRKVGVKLAHYGPHTLRHACAQHLLSQGLTLKEIGDHLGQDRADSTRIYAKEDMKGLGEVAAFDLGEVA
ncbi:MAG: tyrosine-type recombinase/integrase [Elusimicrobia bacterium]|nr:tyrosine-type recombinase/integrase [Elusimicrobiota bacterium]